MGSAWKPIGGRWFKVPASKGNGYCRNCKQRASQLYAGNLCELCVNADTDNAPTGRKANCIDCKKLEEVGQSGRCSICGLIAANTPVREGLECGTCHKSFDVLTAGGSCFRCAKRAA